MFDEGKLLTVPTSAGGRAVQFCGKLSNGVQTMACKGLAMPGANSLILMQAQYQLFDIDTYFSLTIHQM